MNFGIRINVNWYKTAGYGITKENLDTQLKSVLKASPFFLRMFSEYGVSINKIDEGLSFKVAKLSQKHAESNFKEIILDEGLFENERFIDENMHFVVHELVHWLTRQREKQWYFTDPEEIEAFTLGVAFEMMRGRPTTDIERIFYPIIAAHFENAANAQVFFKAIMDKAVLRTKSMKQENIKDIL
jgi:hypothetical protein